MRYDWGNPVVAEEDSREFFEEIDKRFFTAAGNFIPSKAMPFDSIIDFSGLGRKSVLEVGVGCGSHAHLLAPYAHSFVGIDLTDYAVRRSAARMREFGLRGNIVRMDAESMAFPDGSFDFVWSWGVIHHSADTGRVLGEMSRVLKPGGKATVMVYHRSLLGYYIIPVVYLGLLKGEFLRARSIHRIAQSATDGALARYYKVSEWNSFASKYMTVERTYVVGQKCEMIPLPGGRLKDQVLKIVPDWLGRLVNTGLRMGGMLISDLRKPA